MNSPSNSSGLAKPCQGSMHSSFEPSFDLDPYIAMSLLMGGMCHLTAVWLLYGRKFDLPKKGKAVFATLHEGFRNP